MTQWSLHQSAVGNIASFVCYITLASTALQLTCSHTLFVMSRWLHSAATQMLPHIVCAYMTTCRVMFATGWQTQCFQSSLSDMLTGMLFFASLNSCRPSQVCLCRRPPPAPETAFLLWCGHPSLLLGYIAWDRHIGESYLNAGERCHFRACSNQNIFCWNFFLSSVLLVDCDFVWPCDASKPLHLCHLQKHHK